MENSLTLRTLQRYVFSTNLHILPAVRGQRVSLLVSLASLPYCRDMAIAKKSELANYIQSSLILAVPLIGSNLAQAATHLVDAIMLGWYGVAELAAGVLGAMIFSVIFLVCSGCAMAVLPLAASAEGAGAVWRVRRFVQIGLWLSIAFGACAVLLMWHGMPILTFLGQKPSTADLAGQYLRIASWGIFPALAIMVFKSFLMALVRPKIVLISTFAGSVVNAIFNYILIFGNWGFPELGIHGAAYASVISQLFTMTIMLAYFQLVPTFRVYSLWARFWKPDWRTISEVFRLGWPISVTLIAETGFFGVTAIMMGWIDTETLAAHGIALEIAAFVFMIYLGLANAGTAQIGRAVGSGDKIGLALVSRAVLVITVVFVIIIVTIFLAIPDVLVRSFLDSESKDATRVLSIGTMLVKIAAFFQLADAIQVVALGLLRGLGDTRIPMMIATLSYWVVGVPASYILGFAIGFGGTGVWIGFIIGLSLAAILLLFRFQVRRNQGISKQTVIQAGGSS